MTRMKSKCSTAANYQRRSWLLKVAVISTAGVSVQGLQAQQKPVALSETDSQASALGYRSDASKVDKAKYPRFQLGQNCANCNLFQGDAKSGNGLCSIFPGKSVAAQGWCSAWIKKA